MRIIPVIDLKGGLAVRAVGGDRAHYRPVRSILHPDADPVGLAIAIRGRLGLDELYLADLDAIGGAPPSVALYRALADAGLRPWVDAGLRDATGLAGLIAAGVATVVAGLETLVGPEALASILDAVGPDRVVFSLDLRDGTPLVDTTATWGTRDPSAIARCAVDVGARRVLVLDLARVGMGMGMGPTLDLVTALRRELPAGVELAAGGGVAGPEDMRRLRVAGADAVLVGSALHDGRIGGPAQGESGGGAATV